MAEKENFYSDQFKTPLGMMVTTATDNGILMLQFSDKLISDEDAARSVSGSGISIKANSVIDKMKIQLNEYFDGKRRSFDVPLIVSGTAFQQKVWSSLLTISYGEKMSYTDQASALGNPHYVRAVAKANGANRFLILIPCHRVIGKNGQLTGYNGGLWRKTWLLNHERSFSPVKGLF